MFIIQVNILLKSMIRLIKWKEYIFFLLLNDLLGIKRKKEPNYGVRIPVEK